MQPSTFRGQAQRLQQQPGHPQQQQQQQQPSGVNSTQQITAVDSLEQLFASPGLPGGIAGGLAGANMQQQQQKMSQQSQQQQQLGYSQQPSAGGWQQSMPRSTLPYQLQQRRPSAAAAGPAAKMHASVQPDSMDIDALDAGDGDAMDDVVAAIFGSQMPPLAVGSIASQQQQQPARQMQPPMSGGGIAAHAQGEPSQKRLKPAAAAAAAAGAVTGAVLPGSAAPAGWSLQQQQQQLGQQQEGNAPGSSHPKAASGSGARFGAGVGSSFRPQQLQQQAAPLASPALSGAGSAASGGGALSYPGSAKAPLSVRPFAATAAGSGRGQPLLHGYQAVNLLDDLLGDDLEELDR
jgi:hypothetical protein